VAPRRTDAHHFFAVERAPPFLVSDDCTFLCAIPPEQRARWAERCDELVRPGGELVTLIFPVPPAIAAAAAAAAAGDDAAAAAAPAPADPADASDTRAGAGGGPPFAMSPRLVERLLAPTGFSCASLELVPAARRARGATAAEFIARWKKEG